MLEEAVAARRINRPGFLDSPLLRAAYCGARWIGPPRVSLDGLKDAKADEQDIANGTKTREEICLSRTGGDWATKHKQLAREQAARTADNLNPPAPGAADLNADPNADPNAADNETQPKRKGNA